MRTLTVVFLVAAATALVSLTVSAYVFYNKWQSLRAALESVVLTDPIDVQALTLGQASKRLVEQVNRKKQLQIICLFSPPTLGEKMPIGRARLDGTAYFGVRVLEDSYQCRVALAGEDIILFTEKTSLLPER